MVKINVTNREGEARQLEAPEGSSLMMALRDAGFDVQGTCGGMCSCGSCHVFVSEALAAILPRPGDDEQDMLDSLAEVIEVRPSSRLSCQIKVSAALDEGAVEIGPEL